MIIVLEGADGTGKTTLANVLQNTFPGSKYIHATWSRELDCRMLEYHMGILSEAYNFIQKTNLPVIIDRLWLSEAIYAEVFRSGSRYPQEAKIIDKFIEMIGGINIMCLSDNLKKHAERFDILKSERLEMYQNVSHVVQIYNKIWNPEIINDYNVSRGYLSEIINEGGLYKRGNYYKYSIEKEGVDTIKFVEDVKHEFECRNKNWGRK